MPGNMSISVNGQSQVPPGFRFHPTEEELLQYYLKKKVSNEMIDLDVIREVDLNKFEPWDIQEICRIGTTPQNDWYFFSHKDKKYPTGTRTNRATTVGFWKATGRDKLIYSNCKCIGMRKTLVFYKGRAPHGQKSDWIMHEYRLDDNTNETNNVSMVIMGGDVSQEEGWVVCRIFKKKNHHKTLDSPILSTSSITFKEARNQLQMFDSCSSEGALEQILEYMGSSRSCKEEENDHQSISNNSFMNLLQPIKSNDLHERFLKLPSLESPINSTSSQNFYQPNNIDETEMVTADQNNPQVSSTEPNSVYNNQLITNWAALDRLVASQLNCQTETSRQLGCFSDPTINVDDHDDDDDHDRDQIQQIHQNVITSSPTSNSISNKSYTATQDYNSEIDIWSFARSSSSSMSMSSSIDPICHVSNSLNSNYM